jgi:hypothetical protein
MRIEILFSIILFLLIWAIIATILLAKFKRSVPKREGEEILSDSWLNSRRSSSLKKAANGKFSLLAKNLDTLGEPLQTKWKEVRIWTQIQ